MDYYGNDFQPYLSFIQGYKNELIASIIYCGISDTILFLLYDLHWRLM